MRNTAQAVLESATAMRRRSDHGWSTLAGGVDAVAASLVVGDESRAELASQVVDMHLDCVAGDVVLESIELLLDLGARHECTGATHQQLDHGVLPGGQGHGLSMKGNDASSQVKLYLTGREEQLGGAVCPARDRAQSRTQLVDVERLDEIVVRAGIESGDTVVETVAGGHDNHSCGMATVT